MELSEGNRMKLVLLKGMPLFHYFFTEEDLETFTSFVPHAGDLFLATYPKCGTTWMQYLIWGIVHRGATPPRANVIMMKEFPFIELTGPEVLRTLPSPRMFKTHLPSHMVPQSDQAKYVVVVRNPFDCCVSYFHHQKNLEGVNMEFDEYFEFFLRGEVPYGNYFDYLLSWYKYKNRPNVLWIQYEDMKKDIRKVIFQVGAFLGPGHRIALENDEDLVQRIMRHIDFDFMKKNLQFKGLNSKPKNRETFLEIVNSNNRYFEEHGELPFFREGKVGNYKADLSQEQKERLARLMRDKLEGSGLEDCWREFS